MKQLRPKTMNPQPAPSRLRWQGFLEPLVRELALSVLALLVLALLVLPAILGGKNLLAQTQGPQSIKPMPQQKADVKPAHARRRAAGHARVASIEIRPAPEATAAPPPAPPAPIWPANQPPNQAKVSWDSRGLEIEASNSSLDQILHQVAADTGAKLEGLTQNERGLDERVLDQRVFGTYGPGPVRDVLSKLLDGSGYNVLIVGRDDADVPLEVVLTLSSPASPQTAANNRNSSNPENDDAAEPLESEPPSPPMKTPFGNGDSGAPETQKQIMQDILERQQKIDQQQQVQQNNPQQ